MFLMEIQEVQSEINRINSYLEKCLWMDFTLCQSNCGKVELFGTVDQTYNNYRDNYAIKIEFEQPHFISSLFLWQTDTSKPFIHIVSDEEETDLNTKYRVELGNYIFNLNVDGIDSSPVYIAAKRITCSIINENPFPPK